MKHQLFISNQKGRFLLHIYTVSRGDTVYSIARKFGVSPQSVIYANQLQRPDALVLGQALVIPVYTLSITVREGQSIFSIARAIQVSPGKIISENPAAADAIFPGDILTVTFPGENLGTVETNGYAYPNISDASLEYSLPYLTYISPFSYSVDARGNLSPLFDSRIISSAYSGGTAPLMTLTNLSGESGGFSSDIIHSVITDQAAQDSFIANMLTLLSEKGYYGVNIDFEYIYPYDKGSYNQFLRRVSDVLHRRGYIVAAALAPKISANQQGILYTSHDYAATAEIADFVIIMTYEWGYTYGPPMAVSPIQNIRRVLDYAVTEIAPSKLFMSLPNYGYNWKIPFVQGERARTVTNISAVTLASDNGAEIIFDVASQTPFFRYTAPDGRREVWFEDARSISAKLRLINEYSLAGVSWWTVNSLFRTDFLVLQSLYNVRKIV